MDTKIWAHRGASGYAPENTLEAFDLAVKAKADGIELDVHLTADGQIVVTHDETVNRCSNGTGKVVEMTLPALKALDFGCGMEKYVGVKIPTLAEVFDLIRPTNLAINIELKNGINFYPGMEEACLKLIAAYHMEERIWFSSFNHYSLAHLRAIAPQAKIGILYSSAIYEPWTYAKRLQANALHPHYLNLRIPAIVQHCHASDIRVHAWTLNDEDTMGRALQCGVDAIITNYPDVAYRLREAQR